MRLQWSKNKNFKIKIIINLRLTKHRGRSWHSFLFLSLQKVNTITMNASGIEINNWIYAFIGQ